MTRKLRFHDTIIIRTPLLPYQSINNKKEIKEAIKSNIIQEALFLASPGLYDAALKFSSGQITPDKQDRFSYTAYKYLSRMRSRPTPFGLFAGCGTLTWGDKTDIVLAGTEDLKRYSRLDMSYLCHLVQSLEKTDRIREELIFYPNTSINVKNDNLTYIEYFYHNDRRVHKLVEVEFNEFLSLVLKEAKQGKKINEIAKALTAEYSEISEQESTTFISDIIDSQILVSELQPTVTGDEYLQVILRTLNSINNSTGIKLTEVTELTKVFQWLRNLDKRKVNEITHYNDLKKQLKVLNTDTIDGKLFQVDLLKKTQDGSFLSADIKTQLLEVFHFLENFNKSYYPNTLKVFLEKFREKFEDQEIPLLDIMDTERGLGYPVQRSKIVSDLVDEIEIQDRNDEISSTLKLGNVEKKLLHLLIESIKNNDHTIFLDKEIFSNSQNVNNKFPSTFIAFFSLIGQKEGVPSILLKTFGGASATKIIGRFGHLDPKINTLLQEIAEFEDQCEAKDTINAEIVHLPESRDGNVLSRPAFRKFEIPFLAKPSVPYDQQIQLDDLLVSVDANSNKIRLRSKRLNKYIKPRLGSALVTKNSFNPIYRFLGDLEGVNERLGVQFSWGNLASIFNRFPRVCYKNIILSSAIWILNKKDFEDLLKEGKQSIEQWRKSWNLPQKFMLCDGDNELLIDLNSELSCEVFLNSIKHLSQIILEEFLFDSDTIPVVDKNGHMYGNQFIATLFNEEESENLKQKKSTHEAVNVQPTDVERTFLPGSRWLYYKFYCGIEFADSLIAKVIMPLIDNYIEKGQVSKWFFIRYNDPDFHVRVRIELNDLDKLGQIISTVHQTLQPYKNDGLISKIQMDTYNREIERYGAETMVTSEKIFYADSVSVAKFLVVNEELENEQLRWQFAIFSLDSYLNSFLPSIDEKQQFVLRVRDGFGQEFGMENKQIKIQLNNRYRKLRKDIELLTQGEHPLMHLFQPITASRNKAISDDCNQLKKQYADSKNDQLWVSYLHMHINRLFQTKQRFHEFVLYYLLEKQYKSMIERIKYQKNFA